MEYKEITLEEIYVTWYLDLLNNRTDKNFGEYCDSEYNGVVII